MSERTENRVEILLQKEDQTHVLMEWSPVLEQLVKDSLQVHNSLKEATDMVEKLIEDNPDKTYKIFQLRTIMEGSIEIKRQDFNS